MSTRSGKKKQEMGVAPHFVQPLKPLIAEEKQPTTLQCTVTGQPTPTVKWYKANKEIVPGRGKEIKFVPETGLATLKLLEPVGEDETVYSVRAFNTFGRAECRANLILNKAVKVTKPLVLCAPKITHPLEAMIITPGRSVTLEATFEGTPTPEVRWYRNGKEILPSADTKVVIENNKTTLHIPEASKTDGGKYEVRAMNPAGEARTSGSVAVKAPEPEMAEVVPPRFIDPIRPQVVAEGEVVIMEVRVDSHPTCSFQWFQHAVPIKSSPEMRVVTEDNHSVLLVSEVLPEYAGMYTCRAENVAGSVTSTATVSILPETEWEESVELASPTFIKPVTCQRVMDGERVEFSCQVVGKPLPKISWFHKMEPVQEEKDVTFYQDSEGVCKLAISEVFPEDAGEYTCQAVNKVGEAVCAASLVVEAYEYVPDAEIASVTMGTSLITGQSGSEEDLLAEKEDTWEEKTDLDIKEADVGNAPYFITKLPVQITSRDGELTRLEVKAEGTPKPTIRWYKQGTEIVPSKDFQVEYLEDGSSILTILEAFPDDSGEILCEAQNELGLDQTVCQLDIESILGTKEYRKPEWVTHMEELQEALRATQCVPTFVQDVKDVRAQETETVVFECQYQGMPVPDIVWYRNDKLISNTKNLKITTKNLKSTCTIQHVTLEDEGTYVCKATSQIGETVSKGKLHVQELPEDKKREWEIKQAKEEEEKIKTERARIEKKRLEKRMGTVTLETDTRMTAGIQETQVLESTTRISQTTRTAKAERVISVAESVETSAIASCKKIDDKTEKVKEIEQKAVKVAPVQQPLTVTETRPQDSIKQYMQKRMERRAESQVTTQESVSVSQVQTESTVKELVEKKPKPRRVKPEKKPTVQETAVVTEVQTSRAEEMMVVQNVRMANEVEETMKTIKAREFGPGESPLRELAKIGFLVRQGISVNEIVTLYQADIFPELRTPQAQSALVQVVERRGYGTLISQVLTEESTTDETEFASTVGFRAFMRMVELNYATVEEVITHFVPEDFSPQVWESSEASQVVTKVTTGKVEVSKRTDVQVQAARPSDFSTANNSSLTLTPLGLPDHLHEEFCLTEFAGFLLISILIINIFAWLLEVILMSEVENL